MNRPQILVLGAGNIGRAISELLLETGRYRILIGDRDGRALGRLAERDNVDTMEVDCADEANVKKAMSGCRAVVSALPFQLNLGVAQLALEAGVSYFNLTEDVDTTSKVRQLAAGAVAGQVFMPQCGLAPGFIGILAHHLSQWFDEIESVKLRVGALPRFATNYLLYNLTWCTDGLINQYCKPCEAIHNGKRVQLQPLEGAAQRDPAYDGGGSVRGFGATPRGPAECQAGLCTARRRRLSRLYEHRFRRALRER